jgi:thymidylate synthase (FAD)
MNRGDLKNMDRKPILDHGYLEFVESWGSDERIIEAARMSTAKGFLGWGGDLCPECDAAQRLDERDGLFRDLEAKRQAESCACKGTGKTIGDEKLLRYLWENKHHTPFDMAGMTVEVQAPILVFREWHRHRVPFGYNEMSARYTPLPDVNYIPTVERLMVNSKTNRQAGVIKGAYELTEDKAQHFREELMGQYKVQEELYQWALQAGVPKELARVHLPVGRYSRMRATSNLRGWLGFLTLRMAPAAQFEIREYANAVGELIAEKFPRTWGLFIEGKS